MIKQTLECPHCARECRRVSQNKKGDFKVQETKYGLLLQCRVCKRTTKIKKYQLATKVLKRRWRITLIKQRMNPDTEDMQRLITALQKELQKYQRRDRIE